MERQGTMGLTTMKIDRDTDDGEVRGRKRNS